MDTDTDGKVTKTNLLKALNLKAFRPTTRPSSSTPSTSRERIDHQRRS
jgi:hypothetical protein